MLCTNTMHKVADRVQAAVGIPLLHLADTTAAAVRAAGLRRPSGCWPPRSRWSRTSTATGSPATACACSSPTHDDRAAVHRVIYDELCRGVVREESRRLYRQVIERLVAAGAQGIVLGCTEIELLIGPADSPVPVFPTTRLHVEAALDASLQPGPLATAR